MTEDWMNPKAWTAFGLISPTLCFAGLAMTLAFGIDLEVCLAALSILAAALAMYQLPKTMKRVQRSILFLLTSSIIFAYCVQSSNSMADAHESILNADPTTSETISALFVTSAVAGAPDPTVTKLEDESWSIMYWKRGEAKTITIDDEVYEAIASDYLERNPASNAEQKMRSPLRVFRD
jgi:hypothetical protein